MAQKIPFEMLKITLGGLFQRYTPTLEIYINHLLGVFFIFVEIYFILQEGSAIFML